MHQLILLQRLWFLWGVHQFTPSNVMVPLECVPVYSLKGCGSSGVCTSLLLKILWFRWSALTFRIFAFMIEYDFFLVYLLTFKVFEGVVSVEVDVIHEDDDVLAGIQKSSVVQIGHQVHDTIQITQEDIN